MTDRDRVLVSCKLVWDSLPEHAAALDRMGVDVVVPEVSGQQLGEPELLGLVADIDGILAGDDEISRTVIEAAPRLRVISKWGIGVDAIDHQAAAEHGIAVFNTPGVFADELADYALGFLLMLARRQHEVDRAVREGSWHKVRGTSLRGRVLGIVGLGSSGRALAGRAAALGMRVLGSDPVPPDAAWLEASGTELVPFEGLLEVADVISLHLSLTVETRAIIDETAIRRMKRGIWFINTSRGGLVDEEALVRALVDERIGAAALDVFAEEPLAPSHPLTRLPNVILGSHNASNTAEAVARTNAAAIRNLLRGLGKEPA